MNANKHLIKVFSGPHFGAEILLTPGRYCIGSGKKCDIVLQDECVEKKHLYVTVREGKITLLPLIEESVWVDGNPLHANERVEVEPYSVITIGTTQLAIGEPGGNWSSVSFASLKPEKSTSLIAQDKPSEQTDDSTSSGSSIKQNVTLSPWLGKATESNIYGYIKKSFNPSDLGINKPRLRSFGYIFTAAIILTGMTFYIGSSTINKNQNAISKSHQALISATTVIKKLNLDDVNVQHTNDGRIAILGFVNTLSDYTNLSDGLNQNKKTLGDFILKVKIGEQLASSAEQILRVMGFRNLKVEYKPQGAVSVKGYTKDMQKWQEAKKAIKQDIPQITKVYDQRVQTLVDRRQSLLDYLAEKKLNRKLSVFSNTEHESLTVEGLLAPEEYRLWLNVLNKFRKEYGRVPKVLSRVADTRDAVELDIRSVRVSQVPYFITQDGTKYLQGAHLPNGFSVKSIHSDKIVLTKNNTEAIYHLN